MTSRDPIGFILRQMALWLPLFVLPLSFNHYNLPKFGMLVIYTAIMAVIVLWNWLSQKETRKPDAFECLIFTLMAFNVASLIYTQNPYYTRMAALLNISCLAVLLFTANYYPLRNVWPLFEMITIAGVWVGVVTIMQALDSPLLPKMIAAKKIVGTIGNGNYLGHYLLFPIFTTLALFIRSFWGGFSKTYPVIVSMGFFILMIALILSKTRAAWLAFTVGFIVFLWYGWPMYSPLISIKIKSTLVFLMICLTGIGIAGGVYFGNPKRVHRIVSVASNLNTNTMGYRIKYWQASLELWKKAPILGTGLWSYRNLVYDAQAILNKKDPDYLKGYKKPKPRRAHCDYLETLNDGGVIGFGIASVLIVMVMCPAWKLLRSIRNYTIRKPGLGNIASLGAFSSIVAILVSAVFFFPFRIHVTMFMTALMLGFIKRISSRGRPI